LELEVEETTATTDDVGRTVEEVIGLDDEEDEEFDNDYLPPYSKYIDWQASEPILGSTQESSESFSSSSSSSSSSSLSSSPATRPSTPNHRHRTRGKSNNISVLEEILPEKDLYKILGVERHNGDPDKHVLRRAYLSRSKACHPDKFPGNPNATRAFQKVSVAYDILSHSSTKKNYDSKSYAQQQQFDFFSTRFRAEETLRSVLLGVFNDFLEADLEVVRTFLRTLNDLNPTMRLGEEGINSVLLTLHSVRERALTCRTCIVTLHAELLQLLELQAAFRRLSYFDVISRSKLTMRLVRITVGLPLKVEEALISESKYRRDSARLARNNAATTVFLPQKVFFFIRGIIVVLEKMENVLS